MKTNNTRNAFNQCPYIFDLSLVPRVVNNESKYPPIYILQYYCNLEMQYEKSIKAIHESRVNMPAPEKYTRTGKTKISHNHLRRLSMIYIMYMCIKEITDNNNSITIATIPIDLCTYISKLFIS